MSRPADLPDFGSPPLSEVAVSLQFAQLSTFGIVHAGLLWEIFKDSFPRVEYKGQLVPTFETFGLNRPGPNQLHLQFGDVPELPRLWFLDQSSSQLIQFQPDRFIHNWRKTGDGNDYPRYERIKADFIDEIASLQKFLSLHELGVITPNQCEISYVNTVRAPAGVRPFQFLDPVANPLVGRFEDAGVVMRYRLEDGNGTPVGRIIINATPGVDPSGENVIQLTITGRGPPAEPTLAASMAFFDMARVAVVNTFAAITASEMHKLWDRKI